MKNPLVFAIVLVVLGASAAISAVGCSNSGDSGGGGSGGGGTGGSSSGGSSGGSGGGGAGMSGGAGASGGAGTAGSSAGAGGSSGAAGAVAGSGGTAGGGAGGNAGAAGAKPDAGAMTPDAGNDKTMSFFASSTSVSTATPPTGDFKGLEGADKHCDTLAKAAGVMGKKWVAYLSADMGPGGQPVNARDRVAAGGPWYDSMGRLIALNVADLHQQPRPKGEMAAVSDLLNEKKATVGDAHDITTGSNPDGTLKANATCKSWTSSSNADRSQVGHSNLQTAGQNTMSWNSSHVMTGPTCNDLRPGGGIGRVYCFAVP